MAEGGGEAEKMNAILIGGTGATGRCMLGSLLQAKDKVAKVTVLGRRKVDGVAEGYGVNVSEEEKQGRLVQHVQDLDEVSEDKVKELCTGSHVFFNCMGTTRAIAGSKQDFIHIDYEIPLRLIKLAKVAGVKQCSVLTSMGSNPNSWFLYPKTKGQMEESSKEEAFEYTSIFRPGLLDRGGEKRTVEKIAGIFVTPMKVSNVATAMLQDAWAYHNNPKGGTEGATTTTAIYNNTGINSLCQEAAAGAEKK